jgi:F-type H+-transporting ATPase subunit b
MANVRTIAADAASAIVERLTGSAPAKDDVANAVGDALKR